MESPAHGLVSPYRGQTMAILAQGQTGLQPEKSMASSEHVWTMERHGQPSPCPWQANG
jgi:hypothetical protein